VDLEIRAPKREAVSKRKLLAKAMHGTGFTRVLEMYRARPGILLINHHRIGDPNRSRFDRGVFSATAEQLDEQLKYLKKWFPILGAEELDNLVYGGKPIKRLHVGITFDDGYRDNYTSAFPVLRSHGCCGMFFLVPTYVGTNAIPWWDEVAYLVRNSRKESITLEVPVPKTIALQQDRENAIHQVLQHYKRPDNKDHQTFLMQLRGATGCELPVVERRFLTWDEAREMQGQGMAFGSHTWSHRILSHLQPDDQRRELVDSRSTLEKEMGAPMTTLAYPVGSKTAFSETTRNLATEAGYRLCFSFYGGVNAAMSLQPADMHRTSVEPDTLMFRNQVVFLSRLGRLPY
jgi:peptidoglycan/xylan/chitin deacetylase (PgdA/CDA1 family)